MQESLHEFVHSKARHILGDKEIQEIKSIAHEDEAKRIANLFPSVPTTKPTLKKEEEKEKKQKRKKLARGKNKKEENSLTFNSGSPKWIFH